MAEMVKQANINAVAINAVGKMLGLIYNECSINEPRPKPEKNEKPSK